MRLKRSIMFLVVVASLSFLTTGCRKKVAVAPPAPTPPAQEAAPPPPTAPTASLAVEPSAVEPGEAVTLKWTSTNATDAAISGLGTVAVEGAQQVWPTSSTTYELVATGPGGYAKASATVNLLEPLPLPIAVPPAGDTRTLPERLEAEVSDTYFDYDQSGIREDARVTLAKDAAALRSILADFPNSVIVMEGHCDERGSAEYNLALGDRRATSASAYLEALGLSSERLQRISYGKERPQCTESSEACWQNNRRVHFAAGTTSTN